MTKSSLHSKLKAIRNMLLELIFKCLPIRNNLAMFFSFDGQYNDNPRYISEKLHELDNSVRIVWALNKNGIGKQPDYVKVVRINTVRFLYYSAVAKVYVDNYTGKYSFRKNVKLPCYFRLLKRKGQFNLSTWHGTPLKKIHTDVTQITPCAKGCFTTCDMFISGNEFLSQNIKRNLCDNIFVKNVGTPRNDFLLNFSAKDVTEIKAKNGFLIDEKIVLYAPTFRHSLMDSGINQMQLLDIDKLLKMLSNKFGGKWRFALRTHPGVFMRLKDNCEPLFKDGTIIDANQYSEMAEYLIISDVLITDYSGSLFDYCLLKRPCFLFAHDLQDYRDKERGLYIDIDELPFTFAQTFDELLININNFDNDENERKIEVFKEVIGYCENGKASETAAMIIINQMG